MPETLNIGLIGCGRIAEIAHMPAYRQIRKGRVIAVADVDETRARNLAEQFDVKSSYGDPAAILENQDIDVVDICLPIHLHSKFVLAAIDQGKHVFCEKPFALNVSEADSIVRKLSSTNLKLMVGYNQRFEPQFRKMQDLFKSRMLGRLTTIEGKHAKCDSPEKYLPPNWRSDPRKGGGALLDHACHKFDMINWFAGKPTSVKAISAYNLGTEAEDTAAVIVKHETGVISMLSLTLYCAAPVNELDIFALYGDKGTISFSSTAKKELKLYLRGRLLGRTTGFTRIGLSQKEDSYTLELATFLDSILKGTDPPVTAEDARTVLQISEAARRSADTEKPIDIPIAD